MTGIGSKDAHIEKAGLPEIERVAYDATVEAIVRTRRTLVLLIATVCVGVFHQYIFYLSWEHAQMAGRLAVLSALSDRTIGEGEVSPELAAQLRSQVEFLRDEQLKARIQVPLIGLEVIKSDFSLAVQMVLLAVLLWLLFNQIRMNECLRKLMEEAGWGLPLLLIELHFGLIGSRGRPFMKWVGRLLPLAAPSLSLLFFVTDCFDISRIVQDPIRGYAFRDSGYSVRALARLGTAFSLSLGVVVVGSLAFREWLRTEGALTRLLEAKEGSGLKRGSAAPESQGVAGAKVVSSTAPLD